MRPTSLFVLCPGAQGPLPSMGERAETCTDKPDRKKHEATRTLACMRL